MSVLQDVAGGITSLIAPDLQNVENQATAASQQLQLAFEVIIAEGVIIAGLLIVQIMVLYKKRS